MSTMWWTALALVAFAANSILCRMALQQGAVDPATFSTIRVISGAATLLIVTTWTQGAGWRVAPSWTSAGVLALYAVPFAFAYTRLSVGTGALILFGCVQATMLVAALRSGERPHAAQWLGLGLALTGLVYLVLPGLSAPPLADAALMGIAGLFWGLYSLRGRGTANPLAQTTSNFVRAIPVVLLVSAVALPRFHVEPRGVWLAAASGALASGLGYAAWFAALGGLTATRAAIVQLAVPVIAASGGVLFLQEAISVRLVLSALMILGGIAVARPGAVAGSSPRRGIGKKPAGRA
jgi:drug/metabolite transporter (DMT)-like permease